jgi:hypothetical protein
MLSVRTPEERRAYETYRETGDRASLYGTSQRYRVGASQVQSHGWNTGTNVRGLGRARAGRTPRRSLCWRSPGLLDHASWTCRSSSEERASRVFSLGVSGSVRVGRVERSSIPIARHVLSPRVAGPGSGRSCKRVTFRHRRPRQATSVKAAHCTRVEPCCSVRSRPACSAVTECDAMLDLGDSANMPLIA